MRRHHEDRNGGPAIIERLCLAEMAGHRWLAAMDRRAAHCGWIGKMVSAQQVSKLHGDVLWVGEKEISFWPFFLIFLTLCRAQKLFRFFSHATEAADGLSEPYDPPWYLSEQEASSC